MENNIQRAQNSLRQQPFNARHLVTRAAPRMSKIYRTRIFRTQCTRSAFDATISWLSARSSCSQCARAYPENGRDRGENKYRSWQSLDPGLINATLHIFSSFFFFGCMAHVCGFRPAFLPPSIPGSHLAKRLHVRTLLIALSALATLFNVQYYFSFYSSYWTTTVYFPFLYFVFSYEVKNEKRLKVQKWGNVHERSSLIFFFPRFSISCKSPFHGSAVPLD